ncbi:carbohydrate ABC transporter permease [Salinisphaera orenii]|uniref:carbohydrate ABC transporter permease n=1 Tax=Salinisphaera orenii TaxID=856731 RepID=UPI000DBE7839
MSSSLQNRRLRSIALIGPAALYLFVWMIVPLAMTVYYSFRRYNLIQPFVKGNAGFSNYAKIIGDPNFLAGLVNTLILVSSCLILTVVIGLAFAVIYNSEHVIGKNLLRTLAASPFFIMPVVTGLVWKNLMMNPSFGLLAALQRGLGITPIAFLSQMPLASIIGIVTWQWTPFAMLVLLASLSSVPEDIKEAAYLDGAGAWKTFRHIILPQLGRPLYAVIMLETIFFLIIFGQIYVATSGGPGNASTNLPYYIYLQAFSAYDIGAASAGAVVAVILANIVAISLVRMINANIREDT